MFQIRVQESLTEELLNTLQYCKENNLKTDSEVLTCKGFQTPNILQFEEFFKFKKIIQNILPKKFDIFHMHLIDYEPGGYQKGHNHAKTEKYSFILYLNDSDTGHTVFKNKLKIKPEKNKLIVFDANEWHYAEVSLISKKILVGAMN